MGVSLGKSSIIMIQSCIIFKKKKAAFISNFLHMHQTILCTGNTSSLASQGGFAELRAKYWRSKCSLGRHYIDTLSRTGDGHSPLGLRSPETCNRYHHCPGSRPGVTSRRPQIHPTYSHNPCLLTCLPRNRGDRGLRPLN